MKYNKNKINRFGIWERSIIALVCRNIVNTKGNKRINQKVKTQCKLLLN